MASQNLTEYERRRLENIKRNAEMVAALKIHSKATALSATTKRQRAKTYKVSPVKKPKTETPIVIRRSLRTRGMPPDTKGLADDFCENFEKTPKSVSPLKPQSPRVLGPISMRDAFSGDEMESNQVLVETILSIAKKTQVGVSAKEEFAGVKDAKEENLSDFNEKGKPVSCEREVLECPVKEEKLKEELNENLSGKSKLVSCGLVEGVVKSEYLDGSVKIEKIDPWLESMDLKPENVARLLPGRIMVVKFFPCSSMRMIAAGNKFGNIAFWNVDCEDEQEDGIYLYRPHTAPVSGILIQQYSMSKPNNFTSLYFGEGRGGLNIWDIRTGKSSKTWMLHEDRINTIDFNSQNSNIMATSSTDGTACIWDLRSMSAHKTKTLKTVSHSRAVHSAYFSPSGSSLATTSFDNKIGIISGVTFEGISMIYHDNWTGRWLSSFRAIWGWDDSYIFIGNMKRGVDVISPAQRRTVMTLQSPEMSAIPCRFDSHPHEVGMLAGATSGGQVYMWTPRQEY
ncbi:WD repeat-containing protein 76-like isoform X2 [Durio zibethinus]|uniref:WD repeat-containing protein 76-like isoform X2 n=1 Tax=Durio zibethinus TaxID=66656 RepID=A0A6P5XUJ4_DURZI|nr:WD repeat-containing protein 76-like isoform X2 [Durio zibethinus]